MSVEENKKLTMELFEALSVGDWDVCERLIDESVEWWVIGDTQASGVKNKEKYIKLGKAALSHSEKGLELRYGDITAEGDRVMLEAWGNMQMKNGNVYANTYVFKTQWKNGKVISAREFLDTALIDRVFGPKISKKAS